MFFIFYVLTLQENSYCKQGPLNSILLYLPLYDFCLDMPDDDLSTDRNM